LSAKDDAQAWTEIVQRVANKRGLSYEPVGGLNPVGQPAALCPGGSNRLTGELSRDYWGASCDADEREDGGLFSKAVLPHAILAKAHMPDLAKVMPPFNVESIEARPSDMIDRASRKRVEFESIEFNKRFIATVARDHDPIAVREMFSPAFLAWAPTIDREVDFGVSEQQLYFNWRMHERTQEELEMALDNAGQLFKRVRREMEEHDVLVYKTGPWYAGLEPFPSSPIDS
jgi:hypothetical protein